MTTPFHIVSGLTVFGRKHKPENNFWILAGSLAPDFVVLIFTAWVLFMGIPLEEAWDTYYFSDQMQPFFNLTHSFILWILVFLFAYLFKKLKVVYFSLAGILHITLDLLVHHTDAYAHFYPISNWRFRSPVSYYEPGYYGNWISLVDIILFAIFSILIFRKLNSKWSRRVLVVLSSIYLILSLVFYFNFYIF